MRQQAKLPESDKPLPKAFRSKVAQSAALCWRLGEDGATEVLLITSRDTGRWIIPKGNTEKHETCHRCAQREAREEAGVVGRVSKVALGHFSYLKDPDTRPVWVSVHLLHVLEELEEYPERHQRDRIWVSARHAATQVREPDLQHMLNLLADEHMPRFISGAKKYKARSKHH